jgi:tRNA A-37 threonylcarbamoyl transferase component Bud32/uncharacterized protein YggL (DUF469 family)
MTNQQLQNNRRRIRIRVSQFSRNFANFLKGDIFKDKRSIERFAEKQDFLEKLDGMFPSLSETDQHIRAKGLTEASYQDLIKSVLWRFKQNFHYDPFSDVMDQRLDDLIMILPKFLNNDAIINFQNLVLKEKINQLLNADQIQFPLQLGFGDRGFVLNSYLGSGRYGTAFGAYLKKSVRKSPLVVKIYKNNNLEDLRSERAVLELLKRLVYCDENLSLLVFQQIPGKDLAQLIHENSGREMYKLSYSKLARKFFKKTGYIHGDVRPPNVIVDRKTGKLRLIDFGRSFKPDSKEEAERELKLDEKYAMLEYKHSVLYSKMKTAYDSRSTKDEDLKHIEEFIESLVVHSGRSHEVGPEVVKYYRYLNSIGRLDRFRYYHYLDGGNTTDEENIELTEFGLI